jgi:hypothetical protein
MIWIMRNHGSYRRFFSSSRGPIIPFGELQAVGCKECGVWAEEQRHFLKAGPLQSASAARTLILPPGIQLSEK